MAEQRRVSGDGPARVYPRPVVPDHDPHWQPSALPSPTRRTGLRARLARLLLGRRR